MISEINDGKYDRCIEPSDWRYSSAILGMKEYLDFIYSEKYEIQDDCLLYNSHEILEDKYLDFVEYKYPEEMYHKCVENKLNSDDFSDDDIKLVNEKLNGNSVMKKLFKGIKFDGSNKSEIIKIIDENRTNIIKETFRNKMNLYRNFCNTNALFNDKQDSCRLLGYNIDAGKKGKSISYNFNTSKSYSQDFQEFDFITFAFSGNRESFFINDNSTIDNIVKTNTVFHRTLENQKDNNMKNARGVLLSAIIESAEFIDYDVEVIQKNIDKSYFETLFLKKDSIDILKKMKDKVDYKIFDFSYKITDKYYINVLKKVMDCIINQVFLDELIELFIKKKDRSYLVKQLISINVLIRGGEEKMKKSMQGAYACAKRIMDNSNIQSNKIQSYKNKLVSAVIFKDYDRVCQILLQLSNYSNVKFDFVYDLFEDFEGNKELAYTFINTLGNYDKGIDNNNKTGGKGNE